MKTLKVIIVYFISITLINCSTFKVFEDKSRLTAEQENELAINGDSFSMFIYFENSMKGEKIFIKSYKVHYNGIIREYAQSGVAEWITVPNISEIELYINGKRYLIEANKVIRYQYLVVSKDPRKRRQYKLNFTNSPKPYW
ncbi:hypothetical protein [Flavobacterium sp.]|uniref:hypothetical protein n=1 Tax=Flavobacterium sp. TaxID=239 RepID=UPI0026383B92|nr:hypothetical protein [Flavobacterium sp.]